jgi:hypothetical protein
MEGITNMSYISVAIATFVVIALSCCFMYRKQKQKENKHKYRESLKNALLSYALKTVFADRFEDGPISTDTTGTMLPPMSGSDMSMACFSYIVDQEEFKKNPFWTPIMAQKYKKVDDFLDKNLQTREQVKDFFARFIEFDGCS